MYAFFNPEETRPIAFHANGLTHGFLNYLANYVPNAWSPEKGCLTCLEDPKIISGLKVISSSHYTGRMSQIRPQRQVITVTWLLCDGLRSDLLVPSNVRSGVTWLNVTAVKWQEMWCWIVTCLKFVCYTAGRSSHSYSCPIHRAANAFSGRILPQNLRFKLPETEDSSDHP